MPSTTTVIKAFFGAGGPSGTPGVAIYEADGTTVKLAHTTLLITEIASSNSFIKTVTVDLDTEYNVIWDDGGTPLPVSTLYLPTGVNLVTVNGQAVRNGNGTAAGVAAGTITLDATDPAKTANLDGWQVQILEATTGAGQVGTVNSTTTSATKPVTPNWPITLTGTVVYKLNPPGTATVSGGVDVTSVNGLPVKNGNGTAAAFTTTTIDLDTTDDYRAANLAGWAVEILSATTGAGQSARIASSGITSPFRQTLVAAWTLPTGSVRYKLTPPQPATVDTTAIADAVWNATGKLGDGSKPAWKTLTKAVGRLFGKFDRVTVPGSAIMSKVDGSGEAFRQTYSGTANPARGDHTPGSGL